MIKVYEVSSIDNIDVRICDACHQIGHGTNLGKNIYVLVKEDYKHTLDVYSSKFGLNKSLLSVNAFKKLEMRGYKIRELSKEEIESLSLTITMESL
ncbi:MAG TPA: hypothetical protein VIR31_05870 [Nitrososphaeraceae archaeon]